MNIYSDRVGETRDFYVDLLGFSVAFDSDWFVQLMDPDSGSAIGIMQRDHELVPEGFRTGPDGSFVTIVVEDVEPIHARARERGVTVIAPPRDEFYGQRRMLVTDPNGYLVDVSSPTTATKPAAEDLGSTG